MNVKNILRKGTNNSNMGINRNFTQEYTCGKEEHGKMVGTVSFLENASLSAKEIPIHTHYNGNNETLRK